MTDTSRRRVLRTTGVATLLALAGCSGGGGGDGETGPYDGWLADANGFESVADATGQSEVQIDVGAGGGLAFDPAAVQVSPGTTVVWKWTGQGGTHDVKQIDGAFKSDLSGKAGYTFSHSFESVDVYKYVCEPHRSMGMKGVVEVVE